MRQVGMFVVGLCLVCPIAPGLGQAEERPRPRRGLDTSVLRQIRAVGQSLLAVQRVERRAAEAYAAEVRAELVQLERDLVRLRNAVAEDDGKGGKRPRLAFARPEKVAAIRAEVREKSDAALATLEKIAPDNPVYRRGRPSGPNRPSRGPRTTVKFREQLGTWRVKLEAIAAATPGEQLTLAEGLIAELPEDPESNAASGVASRAPGDASGLTPTLLLR